MVYIAAPAHGAALAGLWLASWRQINGQRNFPSQPGHWLLIVVGVQYCLSYFFYFMDDWTTWQYWDLLVAVSGNLGAAIISVTAAIFTTGHRLWRRTFIAQTIGSTLLAAGSGVTIELQNYAVFPGSVLITFIPLCVFAASQIAGLLTALIDLVHRRQFDFFHWVGVIVLFVTMMELLGSFVLWQTPFWT